MFFVPFKKPKSLISLRRYKKKIYTKKDFKLIFQNNYIFVIITFITEKSRQEYLKRTNERKKTTLISACLAKETKGSAKYQNRNKNTNILLTEKTRKEDEKQKKRR